MATATAEFLPPNPPTAQNNGGYESIKNAYTFRSENAINEPLRQKIAASLGYSAEDTVHVPIDANLGEGCGNPLLIASLKEGEFVVDLGSGGGFDCFLASKQVGPTGKVVGVDMTEGMIALANRNAIKMGVTNTSFIHARINQIPLPDNSVDCVMSNCVLNLVPDEDKVSVVREIHRVLKPGGRVAISDYLALKPIPEELKNDEVLRAGCFSGAVEVGVMQKTLSDVGFDGGLLVNMEKDLEIFKDENGRKFVTPCCAGGSSGPASFQIYAHKWTGDSERRAPVVTSVSRSSETKKPVTKSGCCGPKKCC